MNTSDTANKKREQVLALIAGVLVLLVAAWLLNTYYGSSMGTLLKRRAALAGEVERLEQAARSEALKRRLRVYQERSLPTDHFLAASEYQNRLLKLAAENDIREPKIEKAAERDVRDGYHTFSFTFRGRTTLSGWARFLRDFQAYDDLHLIRSVALKPMKDVNEIDATLMIEAVSIPQSLNKTLPSRRRETTDAEADRQAVMRRTIADRAFFSNERPRVVPTGPPPPPTTPKFDVAPYTFVTGIVETYGKSRVCIGHRTSGRSDWLEVGGTFHVGNMPCVVREIEPTAVTVEAAGGLYKIPLGLSFDDAEYLGDAPAKSAGAEDMTNSKSRG